MKTSLVFSELFQTPMRKKTEGESSIGSSSIQSPSQSNISASNTPQKLSIHRFVKIYLYIQMEYCSGQTLKKYLESSNKRSRGKDVLKMFRKLLEGMNAIHTEGIIHRDLKPENIFLDESNNIKIGDFGLASLENLKFQRDASEEFNHRDFSIPSIEKIDPQFELNPLKLMKRMHSFNIGTPLYTSPEQEKGGDYDEKTDVYSLGLILFEMLSDFSTNHERYLSFKALRDKHQLPEILSQKFQGESDLIVKMTNNEAKLRPNTQTVIAEIDKLLSDTTKR